jgi:hypothetical protein
MTGGLVVVDDAGHFGGNMDEQFTAAIDAMADELPPAYSTCPPTTGKATHVLARVRASAHRSSHDQVVGLRPGRAAAPLGRGMVPSGVVAPWQAAPSASMRSAAIHPELTPGPRPTRVWRP